MSITSLSSLANAAFDAARTNLKEMAEAAAQAPATAKADRAAQPEEKPAAAEPAPVKGRRQGLSLDEYA